MEQQLLVPARLRPWIAMAERPVSPGSNNKVTLTGACRRLTILGSRNTVTITFGAGGSVWLVGATNEVTWTTPDGKQPKVHQIGSSNTLKRGQLSPPVGRGSDPFPL